MRLCHPEAETSVAALVQRIERLERAVASGAARGGGEEGAQPTAGAVRSAPPVGARAQARPEPPKAPPPSSAPPVAAPFTAPPKSAPASDVPMPSRDDLTLAWGDHVLAHLPAGARALYKSGRFVDVDGDAAVYALPNAMHRDRCESKRLDVEGVLASHFGRPIALRLVIADETPAETSAPAPVGEPGPPTAGVASALDHVMQAFEGAEVVEE
jgi:DNA polymerase III subunit gamma/tau